MGILNNLFIFIGEKFGFLHHSLKRRRDSLSEEEEDDALRIGCQSLRSSKRPKWMNNPHHSTMSSDGSGIKSTQTLNEGVSSITVPVKNSCQRSASDSKENVEVITLTSSNDDSTDTRLPLSDLTIRKKNKSSFEETYRNHMRQKTPLQGRRPSDIHQRLFNNITKTSQLSNKQTALKETLRMQERKKYSELLADYSRSSSLSLQNRKYSSTMMNDIFKPSCSASPQVVEVVDLTKDNKKHIHLPVKQWQPAESNTDDDDVKIIEERPSVVGLNTLEKKLSQNCVVSPQWIAEMQQRYSEKEREKKRKLEEEKLKRELYASHNHRKREDALESRLRRHLKLTDIVLDDTEVVPPLPQLTPEMNRIIDGAFKPTPSEEILVEGFGQQLKRKDIQTLYKLNWLNDEVINFYMNLLIERGKQESYLKVYSFNTFFYPKLISQGYSSLRRWTKKVDIFTHDLLLFPIHLGVHWCMASIDFRDRKVRYYDSMGKENNKCLNALLQYLVSESLDKKKTSYDISTWATENMKDIPQQMNGSDCGMFSCMFAEYVSRNAKITFSQKEMPYFRRKMVYEIISKKLLM